MTTEQLLISTWRSLSGEEQKVVVDFVEFLKTRSTHTESEENGKKTTRRTPPPELIGKIKIIGDIVGPIVDEADWECLK